MATRTPHRDALRILFLIRAGSIPLTGPTGPTPERIFKGEARLHAFDFWMRNPDYLASELLDGYTVTSKAGYLAAAESIFVNEEPDLRRVPMVRFLYGAYDPMDDTLSLLRSRDLVRITGTKSLSKVVETDFVLTSRGSEACIQAIQLAPILKWYEDRANLISEIAGDRGGNALKAKQYEQTAYASTKLGGIIPPIADDVRRRLSELKETA